MEGPAAAAVASEGKGKVEVERMGEVTIEGEGKVDIACQIMDEAVDGAAEEIA